MRRQTNWPEVVAALSFALVGAIAIWMARDYPLGTITRMGPGFVPVALGVILILISLAIAWQCRALPREEASFSPRAFLFIMSGIFLWAMLVERAGFVAATVVLVIACAAVERKSTVRSTAFLAAGLCLGGYLIFLRGLNIPLAAFGG
ncbi:tripartite tricarboxylate transporter TctB family protein [Afifella pfennigii]|uniref:tripartite tricarboxylate transporter TctB family protein n=1 Tax=Afifella pfennigii TaxID=209897 RepID=UPI00047EC20F|nr:tripartite tricarboxylate transporter TctB family protein [Afifella pfennigii]